MRFSAIRPKWRASSKIDVKKFQLYYGHPQLAGKHLVRATQHTQFRVESEKNDLEPTEFLKRNFQFETEGVGLKTPSELALIRLKLYKLFAY